MKSYSTTASDFLYFKEKCRYWRKFWGLTEFTIHYFHSNIDDNLAQAEVDSNNGLVTLRLAKEFHQDNPTKELLDRLAFHEVCHILLGRLSSIGQSRFISENEHTEAEEAIVRRLENCVLPLAKPESVV